LVQKLGIKPGSRVALVNAPVGFQRVLGPLPDGAVFVGARSQLPCDVILLFVKESRLLSKGFGHWTDRLAPNGGLWVAWPKQSSGVATDLNENKVRDIGLEAGLVDNKVCAIDETWSGLRFVIRRRDRDKRSNQA
jgi:hypothetical protein